MNLQLQRGNVFYAQLGDYTNDESGMLKHVIAGKRPVVIVSNDKNNFSSESVTVVPLTTREHECHPARYQFCMNGISNTALCDQVRTIGKDQLDERLIHTMSGTEMAGIETALLAHLGFIHF